MSHKYYDAAEFTGKVFTAIEQIGNDRIEFATDDGKKYVMFHSQDCCESVTIHDIAGKLEDLIGKKIVKASEETSGERPADVEKPDWEDESATWTSYFFKARGVPKVRIRWHGSSNGYYSESVQIEEAT